MDIKPTDKTIRELLGSKKQFCIPRFQREYSWEKENYQEFFDDMFNCLKIENGNLEPSQYFLGTMLFIGNYDDKKENMIQVVDGQQRLTTITILFSALSDRFISIKEKTLSDKIFEYIMTEDDNGDSVRILQSKTHYPFFSFYIQDKEKSNIEDPASEEEECIKKCYEYLYNRLDEEKLRILLSDKFNKTDVKKLKYTDILKAIRDQVLQTTFISISTHDREQANIIFEILNAKGKHLTYVDLIKNKIFEKLSETEPADYAEDKWGKIKNILYNKDQKEDVGLATFYRHYWISKYKKSVSKKLYDDFLAETKSEDKSFYKKFLAEMEVEAKNYMKFVNPSRDDYKNRKEYFSLVQSLNVLSNYFNIVQVRVVLLALYQLKDKGLINQKELKRIVLFLEDFHFAYNAIMKSSANKVESIYSGFSIQIRTLEKKNDIKKLIENELIGKLQSLMPSFEEFSNKFCALEYLKKDSPDNTKTKYIINKLNCYYEKKELFADDGSIEHIIPETNSEVSRNIGNLILLEGNLNHDSEDKTYEQKKVYYIKSSYKWVGKFLKEHENFEEADIKTRAERMAEIYYTEILNCQIEQKNKKVTVKN